MIALLLANAWACKTGGGCVPWAHDPALADGITPDQPILVDQEVVRGGSTGCSDCAGLGMLDVYLVQSPTDPVGNEVGYSWRVVEGESPFGQSGGPCYGTGFEWYDGRTRFQDRLDLVIAFTPVDAGGEAGPPLEVWIRDPERHEPGNNGSWLLLAPLALVSRRPFLARCTARRSPPHGVRTPASASP